MSYLIPSLLVAVFGTSFISGALSLAGGSILMGIFGWVLPVSVAMILHGVVQAASNGSRSIIYWRHIQWQILGHYAIGAVICIAILAWIAFVPNKAVLFLLLGIMPFANLVVPKGYALDIERTGNAVACGFIVSACLLTAGVSGPLLDIFYVKTSLTRYQIQATKGLTQAIGHIIKVIYFGFLLNLISEAGDIIPLWVFIAVIPLAYLGNLSAKRIVHAMSDNQFKNMTKWITMGLGLIFLGRGVMLLISGDY